MTNLWIDDDGCFAVGSDKSNLPDSLASISSKSHGAGFFDLDSFIHPRKLQEGDKLIITIVHDEAEFEYIPAPRKDGLYKDEGGDYWYILDGKTYLMSYLKTDIELEPLDG